MIYVFDDSGDGFTVQAPDSLNHDMATKVIVANEDSWVFKNMVPDDQYQAPKNEKGEEKEPNHNLLTDLVTPNLFIDRNEDTGRLIPDMDYMNLIDKEFMDDMLYYWSKTDRVDYMRLLDEIEENVEELIDSCFVIDILT